MQHLLLHGELSWAILMRLLWGLHPRHIRALPPALTSLSTALWSSISEPNAGCSVRRLHWKACQRYFGNVWLPMRIPPLLLPEPPI